MTAIQPNFSSDVTGDASKHEEMIRRFAGREELQGIFDLDPEHLHDLCGNLPTKLIYATDGHAYLERHFLSSMEDENGERWYAYLHRFVSEEGESSAKAPHSHPWTSALSYVLTGGYQQDVDYQGIKDGKAPEKLNLEELLAGSNNVLNGDTLHMISAAIPGTTTLFVHNEWSKGWGFLKGDEVQLRKNTANKVWWDDAPLGNQSNRLPFIDPRHGKLPSIEKPLVTTTEDSPDYISKPAVM